MEKPFWAAARRVPALWIEPDAYLRYQPVIEWIRRNGKNAQVLEIGSGDFGLTSYLKYPVVRTDIQFNRRAPAASRVQANAVQLPFQNKTFDLVFSADLLEHVPSQERCRILAEALRVSRKSVLMIFPCGEEAREQDLRIARKFEKECGLDMKVLKEHERFLFPEEKEIGDWFKAVSPTVRRTLTKSFNLGLREFFVSAWLRGRARFVEEMMKMPFTRVFLHSGRCYRRVLSLEVA